MNQFATLYEDRFTIKGGVQISCGLALGAKPNALGRRRRIEEPHAGCDDGLDTLRMSSITYRIATGEQAWRNVPTVQTILADADAPKGNAGKVGGFPLHAGVAAEAHKGQKLERLCRNIARPAISEMLLSLSPQGRVRHQLKTP